MRLHYLSLFLILLLAGSVAAQAGGHTLFGDIKVDESQVHNSKPLSLQIILYAEAGNLLMRQTVSSNGRYRFLNLSDGRYDVAVEVESVEKARVRVYVRSPFRTDFRQDIEFKLLATPESSRSGVVSAADFYNHTTANAKLFRKANEASEKKHYDQAISLFRQIVESDPADFLAWQALGTVLFIQKNFEEAEQAYLQVLSTNPDYTLTLISLGRLRIARGNFEGAILVLSHAVNVEPKSAQANYFLGETFLQQRLGSKAVVYLKQAIQLDPVGMAEAHLRLAVLYNARDLKREAAAEYEAFLKKRPDYPERKKLRDYISANKKLRT